MTRLLVRCASVAVALALLVVGAGRADARDDDDRGVEAKNMKLVGFNDLQARSAYQPIIHEQGGRFIAYVGHHGGEAKNPLNGNAMEKNGTSIVDVTNPRRPVYLKHIPGPSGVGEAGGAQMVRACTEAQLTHDPNKTRHFLLRATASSHEVYNVTDPENPSLVSVVVGNLPNTHKSWWECDTGIAYLVSDGRDLEHATPACGPVGSGCNWRTNRMTQIFDLSNPAVPKFIRNYGLGGQQPDSTGAVPTGVHGMIALGNTIYFGHGTGSNGILQIVDRTKLLDPACRFPAKCATKPTAAELLAPQLGRLDTAPSQGAHTTFPVVQQPVPEFAKNTQGKIRDFVVLVNEAGGNRCNETRQLVYLVDVSTPSKPMPVSNFQVREASGNFCSRGGRFGAHSSNESFTSVFYGKLVFVSWFNAGVRAIDIREPFSPREAGFFIPRTTANTDPRPEGCRERGESPCDVVIQTNNVEVDERGLVFIVDRANTGMHILRLTGEAAKIAGLRSDDDDDD